MLPASDGPLAAALGKANSGFVGVDPQDLQTRIHPAGGAIPSLPRRFGLLVSGRSNLAPKRHTGLDFRSPGGEKRGPKMGPFSGTKMKPHFGFNVTK